MTNRYIYNNRGIEVLRSARGLVEQQFGALGALKCTKNPALKPNQAALPA